jgi:nucleotide-binding universal stress UspA family protein
VRIRIKKILFPTDFSESATLALSHALYLAHRYDAELHMLHVIELHTDDPHNPAHHVPDRDEMLATLRRVAAEQMEVSPTPEEVGELKLIRANERGLSAAPVIAEYAEEHDIDLIIIGSHGRRGLREMLTGSTTQELVRTAPCAVLSVRGPRATRPLPEIRRVLAPVDFSDHSRAALQVARQIAHNYDARLQVLHVLEEAMHPAFYNMGKMRLKDVAPDIEEKAIASLRKLLEERPGPDVRAEYFASEGHAGRDIPKFAEDHLSDLVVIASHGMSNLEQLLIGSVTEKVVRRSPCAVLVVRAFQKSLLDESTA